MWRHSSAIAGRTWSSACRTRGSGDEPLGAMRTQTGFVLPLGNQRALLDIVQTDVALAPHLQPWPCATSRWTDALTGRVFSTIVMRNPRAGLDVVQHPLRSKPPETTKPPLGLNATQRTRPSRGIDNRPPMRKLCTLTRCSPAIATWPVLQMATPPCAAWQSIRVRLALWLVATESASCAGAPVQLIDLGAIGEADRKGEMSFGPSSGIWRAASQHEVLLLALAAGLGHLLERLLPLLLMGLVLGGPARARATISSLVRNSCVNPSRPRADHPDLGHLGLAASAQQAHQP